MHVVVNESNDLPLCSAAPPPVAALLLERQLPDPDVRTSCSFGLPATLTAANMVSNPAQAAPKRKSPFAFFSGDANGERLNGEWGSTNGSEHGVTGDMIWNESIAGALGYGKK